VFCGSSSGSRPEYLDAARSLGAALAGAGLRLVYGGASLGLMGAVADAALEAGGEVVGVMPEHLVAWEIAHPGLTELRVVASMHDRKLAMAESADAFAVLPGGLGTLEEAFEVLTWTQLGLHAKPLAFLDVAGYYEALAAFLDHAAAERLVRPEHRAMASFHATVPDLLGALRSTTAPEVPKWADEDLERRA
jgi:uncharacterized protein (TIGR00730 family)